MGWFLLGMLVGAVAAIAIILVLLDRASIEMNHIIMDKRSRIKELEEALWAIHAWLSPLGGGQGPIDQALVCIQEAMESSDV